MSNEKNLGVEVHAWQSSKGGFYQNEHAAQMASVGGGKVFAVVRSEELRRLVAENDSLRKQLAQPTSQDEPVAWMYVVTGVRQCVSLCRDTGKYKNPDEVETPLYTHTQPNSKPLTDAHINAARKYFVGESDRIDDFAAGVRFAERHHGIKELNDERQKIT